MMIGLLAAGCGAGCWLLGAYCWEARAGEVDAADER
jgi:hypothetical protein